MRKIALALFVGLSLAGCKKETPKAKGDVTFWQKINSGFDVTNVTIENETQVITVEFSGSPDCGASGAANFKLEEGTYSYHATDGVNEWDGTISVKGNACNAVELY